MGIRQTTTGVRTITKQIRTYTSTSMSTDQSVSMQTVIDVDALDGRVEVEEQHSEATSSPATRRSYACQLFISAADSLTRSPGGTHMYTARRSPFASFGAIDLGNLSRGVGQRSEDECGIAPSLLGEGGQGTVCLCRVERNPSEGANGTSGHERGQKSDEENIVMAAKDLDFKFRYEAEAAYAQSLLMYQKASHQKLIRYVAGEWGLQMREDVDTATSPTSKRRSFYLTILMPFYNEGDLYSVLKENEENYRASRGSVGQHTTCPRHKYPLNPTRVAQLGLQVCAAVRHLHSRRPWPIVHGDIKAQNVLFFNGREQCVLIDLDVAFEYKPEGASGTSEGTAETEPMIHTTESTESLKLENETCKQERVDDSSPLRSSSDTETEPDTPVDGGNQRRFSYPPATNQAGATFLTSATRIVSSFLSRSIFGSAPLANSARKRPREAALYSPSASEGVQQSANREETVCGSPPSPAAEDGFDLSIRSFIKRPFTAEWAAPETLLSDGRDISPRSDIWSLGLLLLCLLTGRDCTFLKPRNERHVAPPKYSPTSLPTANENPSPASRSEGSSFFSDAAGFLRESSRHVVSNLSGGPRNPYVKRRAPPHPSDEFLANSFEEWEGDQQWLSNTIRWIIHKRLLEAFEEVFVADVEQEETNMAMFREHTEGAPQSRPAPAQRPLFRQNKNRNYAAALLSSRLEAHPSCRDKLQADYLSTFARMADIIVKCLSFDPLQRPRIEEVENQLRETMAMSRMGPWEE